MKAVTDRYSSRLTIAGSHAGRGYPRKGLSIWRLPDRKTPVTLHNDQ